jgi:hypothetical protein
MKRKWASCSNLGWITLADDLGQQRQQYKTP